MRKRRGELYGRVERAAEGRVRTCGRRSGRGAYIEVEYEGEEGERGGASPDSGRMVSGVCVVCSPYEGTRPCWEGSGGSREGGVREV